MSSSIYPHVRLHNPQQILGTDFFAEEPDFIRLRCRILAAPRSSMLRLEREADLAHTLQEAACRPGARVVLVGERGSGKSTALKQLAQMLAASVCTAGAGPYPIFLSVDKYERHQRHQHEGVMGQWGDDSRILEPARDYWPQTTGARVYLVDGLDDMTHTPGQLEMVNRLLCDYLALADRGQRTSVVIVCHSAVWLSDIAQRSDVVLVETSGPTRAQLVAAMRAARGPQAEPLLRRLGLDSHDPTVALALMNRTLFARILMGAELGWDTLHLPPLQLMDHLLEDWMQHRTGHSGFDPGRSERCAAATSIAGRLFEWRLARESGLPDAGPGRDDSDAGHDPFLLTSQELRSCLRAAGICADGARTERAAQLSPYIDCLYRTGPRGPLYGFIRDEFHFYFTARYLCQEERLRGWIARPEVFWQRARMFPDAVAGILRYALLMLHETQPGGLPCLLEQLLETSDQGLAEPGGGDPYRERASRLFILLGAYEGILQTCSWNRSPRLRSAVKGLVSRLAALYEEGAPGAAPERATLRGDTRYYAARRASRCGFELVEAIWNWCSRSESIHIQLFAVEVARQYGVFEPNAQVLRLMVSLAKIEQAALSQDYQQRQASGAPIQDEYEHQHLLYHLMEGIYGVLTAVVVPEVDDANIERVVDEVLHPLVSTYFPVIRVLAHCIQVARGRPGLSQASQDEAAERCLVEANDLGNPVHVRVHAMKAYSLVRPDDLMSLAGFLLRPSVFLGEEILPLIQSADLDALSRGQREQVASILVRYRAEICDAGQYGVAEKLDHLRDAAQSLIAALTARSQDRREVV